MKLKMGIFFVLLWPVFASGSEPSFSYIDVDNNQSYDPNVDIGSGSNGALAQNVAILILNSLKSTGSFDTITYGSQAGLKIQDDNYTLTDPINISIRSRGHLYFNGRIKSEGKVHFEVSGNFASGGRTNIKSESITVHATGDLLVGGKSTLAADKRELGEIKLNAFGTIVLGPDAKLSCASLCEVKNDLGSSGFINMTYANVSARGGMNRTTNQYVRAQIQVHSPRYIWLNEVKLQSDDYYFSSATGGISILNSQLRTYQNAGKIRIESYGANNIVDLTKTKLKTSLLASIVASQIIGYQTAPLSYYGFGSQTTGKPNPTANPEIITVSSLGDTSTQGTLRYALQRAAQVASSTGSIIRFTVSGTIVVGSDLGVPANTVIDGFSSPGFEGISLRDNRGSPSKGLLFIFNSNVIVRGLKFRSSKTDGIQISPRKVVDGQGSDISNIVIDHCSIVNSADEGISITGCDNTGYPSTDHILNCPAASVGKKVSNVTISWNYLAGNGTPTANNSGGASMAKWGADRVSWYGNVFEKNVRRNPRVSREFFDIRSNIIRDPNESFTQVGYGARVNIINNFYYGFPDAEDPSDDAVFINGVNLTYIGTNVVENDNVSLPDTGVAAPYDFSPVVMAPEYSAATVDSGAGVLPLVDPIDLCARSQSTFQQVRNFCN